jgi:hypothetical protein
MSTTSIAFFVPNGLIFPQRSNVFAVCFLYCLLANLCRLFQCQSSRPNDPPLFSPFNQHFDKMQSILLASVLAFSASLPAFTSAFNASDMYGSTRNIFLSHLI